MKNSVRDGRRTIIRLMAVASRFLTLSGGAAATRWGGESFQLACVLTRLR
jgi:hypothetical protein